MSLAKIATDGTETGLTAANKINEGFIQTDTNKVSIDTLNINLTTTNSNVTALDTRVTSAETDIATNTTNITALSDTTTIDYTPTAEASKPTYQEGRTWYNSKEHEFEYMGEFSDVEESFGKQLSLKVYNNSGSTIVKGSAVRHNGVLNNLPLIVLALADTFEHARVLGIASHDIPTGGAGMITLEGLIQNINTTAHPAGVPLYLSDSIPGTYSDVAPQIKTRIGGYLKNSTTGDMVVDLINNLNPPSFGAYFQNSAAVLNFNGNLNVYQEFGSFLTNTSFLIDTTSGNSFLIPLDGIYDGAFTISLSNISADANGHIIDIEAYNKTGGVSLFTYKMLVGRNDTVASSSFTVPISLVQGDEIVMRYRSSTNVGAAVVQDGISINVDSKYLQS